MTFDLEKTIRYWLDGSVYDLETGKNLLESKRFPYALFFGHLAIEKLLKALVVKAAKEHAPYTHSLTVLISKTKIDVTDTIVDQLAEFTEFHLEARYPDEKKNFYKKCSEEFARKKFAEIEEVYKWLTQKLEE